jgi:integrase
MKVTSETAAITADTVKLAWARRSKEVRQTIRDKQTAGLALIVNATTMTWVFTYKPRGKDPDTGRRWPSKSVTLGNPESLSIKDARHAAAALKGQAAAGRDPHAEQAERREKLTVDRGATVERLLNQYERALPLRPKLRGTGLPSAAHVADELAHARAAAATMAAEKLPATKVDGSHLRKLLVAEGARPATARARWGAISRFFDWVQEEGVITVNPCLAMGRNKRPRAAPARAQYVKLEQLAAMWKAADELDPLYRDLARFLIAIPCRRGEAAEMDWSHLDLTGASWSQPGALTKNGEPHRLHLHPLALDILTARRKAAKNPKAGLVFPAPRSGKPVDTFSTMKIDLDKASGVSGWRWHDFRRSFASVMGEAGMSEPVVDACLNHRQSATRSGVLGVYQQAKRWPEQAMALKAWGAALSAAIEGKAPASNVVQLTAMS